MEQTVQYDGTPSAEVEVRDSGESRSVVLSGVLTVHTLGALDAELAMLPAKDTRIDMSSVERLDTAGAWAIVTLQRRMTAAGNRAEIDGADAHQVDLLDTVANAIPEIPDANDKPTSFADWLESVGRAFASGATFLMELSGFLGIFLSRLARAVVHPREFRLTALVHHCQEVGLRAVPIVSLMAFLIGVVLAFQGSAQLRQFGAEVFVVDLIAISILRELGILLTAIIVAGRTASAFTAAIGSMKMREEIDALTVIGLNPVGVLIFPRLVALTIVLPLLTIIANFSALYGAAVVALTYSGITFDTFLSRLHEAIDHTSVASGMIKAPFMALAIGIVAAVEGMKVGGSAESLGRHVTASVVKSIFAVIVMDAFFAIFYSAIDF